MIRLLTEKDQKSVLEYLYHDLSFNIFPIGDIETFGFSQNFQKVYGEFDDFDNYLSVFLKYRENGIYYSHLDRFNPEYLEIFQDDPFDFMSGKTEIMAMVRPFLEEFDHKQMYFCRAKQAIAKDYDNSEIKIASTKEEFERLYDLLAGIQEFTISRKEKESYVESRMSSQSMGVVLYIEEGEKIVATVATTAETTKNAMVVAVATELGYRKKGYASRLMLALMDLYINDKGKELCLFYDNPEAGKIYLRLGFENIGLWDMYVRKLK